MSLPDGAERHPLPSAVTEALSSERSSGWLHPRRWSREHWVLAGCLALSAVLVSSIVPGFASASRETNPEPWVITEVSLPEPVAQVEADAGTSEPLPEWETVEVRPGQNLGDIFAARGIPGQTLHRLLNVPGMREPLTRIRPGQRFDFAFDDNGALRALRFEKDERHHAVLTLDGNDIDQQVEARHLQHRVLMASGRISDSLFGAAERAGMSTATILELAKVFGYDIDFAQDLRVGDEFHVVYEEVWRDGERLRSGDILAATFINQGKRYQVFRYEFADGRVDYFDAEGRPMKKGFLRMPVDFARISSRFNPARKHPILGTTRAHRGVDYAAAPGTPIMAAGEGKVQFAGWKNGYGRTVILQHGNNVTTLYGHMSRLGNYKTGARVRQGDVIGYVGASGLASGPHLHYEFRIAGVHRDPLTVTMPKPQPLPANELARFRLQKAPLVGQLALREQHLALAQRQQ